MSNISKYQSISGVRAVLIADLEGNILESSKFEYEQNISLMVAYLYKKSNVLIKDFVDQFLEQIVYKFYNGFIVISKTEDEKIILVLSSDKSSLGLISKLVN